MYLATTTGLVGWYNLTEGTVNHSIVIQQQQCNRGGGGSATISLLLVIALHRHQHLYRVQEYSVPGKVKGIHTNRMDGTGKLLFVGERGNNNNNNK